MTVRLCDQLIWRKVANTGREGGAMTDSKVVKASVTWSNNGWTCWFNGQRVLSMVV